MSVVPAAQVERFTLRFVSISFRARAAVERAGGSVTWDRRRRVWLVTMPDGANWYAGTIEMPRGYPEPVDADDDRVRTTVYFWRRARGLCMLWSDGEGNVRHWRDGLPGRA